MAGKNVYSELEVAELRFKLDQLRARRLRLDGKLAHEVFGGISGGDPGWAEAWSLVGETLIPIYYRLKDDLADLSVVTDSQAKALRKEIFTFAGSRDRLLWSELDVPLKDNQDDYFRGKSILQTIVGCVDDVREGEYPIVPETRLFAGSAPLTKEQAEYSRRILDFVRWGLLGRISWLLQPAPIPPEFRDLKEGSQLIKDCWGRGVLHIKPPTKALPGIALVGRALTSSLFTNSRFAVAMDDIDPFISLEEGPSSLPRELALKFSGKKQALLDHRDSVAKLGYTQTGILDNGTSELDRKAIDLIFKAKEQQSFFVFAPTSSGKTRLAHMAIFEAISRRKKEDPKQLGRVVMLAPTKALVGQIVRDLEALVKGTEAHAWSIIEGTRDHPQYNDHLRTMRFDIAVVIPEKLSAMLRIGMNLSDCPLIVVDELQHLVDQQRGLELELLMIDIFERHPELRWVGLSASLGQNTRELLHSWLSTNESQALQIDAEFRPVPSTVDASDGEVSLRRETHDNGTPVASRVSSRKLGAAINALRGTKSTAKAFQRPLELMFDILKSHVHDGRLDDVSTPSILFFVHGRKVALTLAEATRELMQTYLGLEAIDPVAALPYVKGRFAPLHALQVGSAEEALQGLNQLPPSRLKNYVNDTIAHGVGFHTATLDAGARELVEDGFRQGYVRILFATDTLKLGVNLPSDIVINGDMLLGATGYFRLLDKDSVIQRLGRAGRLGLKRQGIGHLVCPEDFPPNYISDTTVEIGIDERIGLGGRSDAADTTVYRSIKAAGEVFSHYLSDWSGGAEYTPQQNNLWLQNALLWRLGRARDPLSIEELQAQAMDLHRRTLSGCLGDSFPHGTISSLLHSRSVIEDEDGKVRLTGRGYALAANALSTENASIVAEIAKAAAEGAGPLTLFYLACTSPAGLQMTTQMSFEKPSTPLANMEAMLDKVREILLRNPGNSPRYFRHFGRGTTDVIGTGASADTLRGSLTTNNILGAAGRDHATALWRSMVLLLRWAGSPLRTIESVAQAGIPDEVAINNLGQTAAYVLGAAADLLGINPTDMTFRTLQFLETEVEIGLPTVLGPLVRANQRSMNRERLLGLWPYLEDPTFLWDKLTDLLDRYMADSGGRPEIPKGRGSGKRMIAWEPLKPSTVAEISSYLAKLDADRQAFAFSLPLPWSNHRIPRNWDTTLAEDLTKITGPAGLEILSGMLEESGLAVDEVDGIPGRLRVSFDTIEASEMAQTFIEISSSIVTQSTVESVRATLEPGQNILIIAASGATHGVVHRSAFRYEACTVVDPSLFFEMIARVYDKNFIRKDRFDESVGELDAEMNAEMLRRMLLNNAPVLTRSDLENRLVSADVAQVPF